MTDPSRPASAPLISVVVCTYNRAALLAQALDTLCAQTLDPDLYEVLVIDNNSTDDTRATVERYAPRIRHVLETAQGLSHARNRGWREARGTYIAYTDDDCKLPPDWLANARRVIEDRAPAALGGPYFAFYMSPKPVWFKDSYASHDQGSEARALGPDEFLDGGNIFVRRDLLAALNGFDPGLGMAGGRVAYGEETDLIKRLRAADPDALVWYDPALVVLHLVKPRLMNLRWLMGQRFAGGRDWYKLNHSDSPPPKSRRAVLQTVRQLGYHGIQFGLDLARGLLRRDRTTYPAFQNYLYERGFRRVFQMGETVQALLMQLGRDGD
ncbi:glycosyltransferase family 2 protein [Aggregatilinea lenta]|uniref:glycosyltransferase family 2 protein n=1 Tax=Aggregatilinea lenta TaxID=913108 RepID=UPI000E5A13C3|nr:glycosyltransferase family 2 protein [Aggregatilinea lenta]